MIISILDKDGNICDANSENAPQQGFCLLCDTPMYRTTKNSGSGRYYAVMPGHPHKYEECRKTSGKTTYDLRKLIPEKMKADLLDLIQATRSYTPQTSRETSGCRISAPIEERILTPRTLAHLHINGLLNSRNLQLANGTWLSDLTINPQFSYMLLGTRDIGPRILQGRPQIYNDSAQTICMKIFIFDDVRGKSINRYYVANLHFKDPDLYATKKRQMFTFNSSSSKLKRSYDTIAAFGIWHRAAAEKCRHYCNWQCHSSNWSCAGYLYADITHTSHIYPTKVNQTKSENSPKSKG